MAGGDKSPGAKALEYAESKLGVHAVHQQAIQARDELDKVLTDLSSRRDELRDYESRLEDAHMLIIADERAKHPDMSQAGMDRHLKVKYNESEDVRECREKLISIRSDIDGLECDKLLLEQDIRIATARMHELGGYFEYLAIIKLRQKGGSDGSVIWD